MTGFGLQYNDEEDPEYNRKHSFPNSERPLKVVHTPLYHLKNGPDWFERWHYEHVMSLCDVSRNVHFLGLMFETTYPKSCRFVNG